jgi:hypothetical protein
LIKVHGKYLRREIFLRRFNVSKKVNDFIGTLAGPVHVVPRKGSINAAVAPAPELRKSLSSPGLSVELGNIMKDCADYTHRSLERIKKVVTDNDFLQIPKPKERNLSLAVKVQKSNSTKNSECEDSDQIDGPSLSEERHIPRKPVLTIHTNLSTPNVVTNIGTLEATPRRQSRLLKVNKVSGDVGPATPSMSPIQAHMSEEANRKPIYSFIKKDPFGVNIAPRGQSSLNSNRKKSLESPSLPEKPLPAVIEERQSSLNRPKKETSMADMRSSFLENRGLIPNFVRIQTLSKKFCKTETIAVPVDITMESLSKKLFTVDHRQLLIFYTLGEEKKSIKTDQDLSKAILSAAGHAGVLSICAEINPSL